MATTIELPLIKDGQLFVDGSPYLIVGAEVHNSSSGSAAAIDASFRAVAELGANTVLVSVTWELFEPEEGEFDVAQVDQILAAAREHDLRVIPLWFGSYKNGMSSYVPGWVKEDVARFPRAELSDGPIEHLSPFSEAAVDADVRAFTELMTYLAREDTQRTVIMVQVENEVGLLGGSRDHSSLANEVYAAQVPPTVIATVAGHPEMPVHSEWVERGSKPAGTWAEVFGAGGTADELFMACAYAVYVERVATAGRAQLEVPLLVNAWLDGSSTTDVAGGRRPGDYPSGGPVIRVAPVWRELAPSIDLLCPDFYFGDVRAACEGYAKASAGLFIPEMHRTADGVAQMFLAVGEFGAMGVSPFGADSLSSGMPDHARLADANAMLRLAHQLIREQRGAQRRGFLLDEASPAVCLQFGDYVLTAETPGEPGPDPAYGMVIERAPGRFVILGRGFTVSFAAPEGKVGIRSAQELHWNGDRVLPGRRLNGDETAAGALARFPAYGVVPAALRIPRLQDLSGMIELDLYRF